MRQSNTSLRERQTASTREEILDIAMKLLSEGPEGNFSHESIAAAAGMGARTVYRYFPDRAGLLEALWYRLREATNTHFPSREEDILPLARTLFREFDAHESLVRAVLTSPAGTEVRDRGGVEGRPAFAQSLATALADLPLRERTRITAAFVAVYSAPFWQLLRDRGNLSGPEAQETVVWTLTALLNAVRINPAPAPKKLKKK